MFDPPRIPTASSTQESRPGGLLQLGVLIVAPPLAPPHSHIFHILAYSPHIGAQRHLISEASESKGPQQPPSSRPARLVMGRTPQLQVLPPGAESPSFFCSIPALSQPPASKAGLHTWAVAWQISDHSHPVSDHHVTTYTCTLRAATSGRLPP